MLIQYLLINYYKVVSSSIIKWSWANMSYEWTVVFLLTNIGKD